MKIHIQSHFDLDGSCCIINILNAVGFKSKVTWRASGYFKIDKLISEIEKDVDVIFVTDLNFTEEQLRALAKHPAKKKIFLDHHIYNFDLSSLCAELNIILRHDITKCGSQITFDYLNEIPSVSIPHLCELNRITNIYDLWKKDDPDFFKLAYPLNDLFWEYSINKFCEKFKNGYKLDEEDITVIERKATEREKYLTLAFEDAIINEEQNILMIMSPNQNFINDWTLKYPEFDVYIMMASTKDNNFQFSVRINPNIKLTINDIFSNIKNKSNDIMFLNGGHELSGGCSIKQSDFSEFMELFNNSIEEWRNKNVI